MRKFIDIAGKLDAALNESSLSRISSYLGAHACGIITAYRGDRPREQNQKLNLILVSTLRSAGYSATAVKGSYIENFGSDVADEVSEHSFFVVNLKVDGDDMGELENFLMAQGERFDQDSILSIRFGQEARLIGVSRREDSFPPYGEAVTTGNFKGSKPAQFMSRVKNRPFTFEMAEGYDVPMTINGLQGMHLLAKTDVRPLL